jgi:hypothetical protein
MRIRFQCGLMPIQVGSGSGLLRKKDYGTLNIKKYNSFLNAMLQVERTGIYLRKTRSDGSIFALQKLTPAARRVAK